MWCWLPSVSGYLPTHRRHSQRGPCDPQQGLKAYGSNRDWYTIQSHIVPPSQAHTAPLWVSLHVVCLHTESISMRKQFNSLAVLLIGGTLCKIIWITMHFIDNRECLLWFLHGTPHTFTQVNSKDVRHRRGWIWVSKWPVHQLNHLYSVYQLLFICWSMLVSDSVMELDPNTIILICYSFREKERKSWHRFKYYLGEKQHN